jgi:hypothetical protein
MPGRETEHEVEELLEDSGFETYLPPKAKYREQDVFGLYDILAFGLGRLYCIQVKGGRDASGITEWFEAASTHEEHVEDLFVQFWHKTDDGWRIAIPDGDSYTWVLDERDGADSRLEEPTQVF